MKQAKYDKYFIPTYARSDAPMLKGKGSYIIDTSGKKYLDFGSGISVTALGHSNPKIVAALKKQGGTLLHASNLYFMKAQNDFVKLLVKHSFGDKVFLCNSGTEANEAAIKFARKWAKAKNKKKYHILSFSDAFHGRTYGGLSATPQKKFHTGFEPMLPGFHYAPFNDIHKTKKILDKYKFAAFFVEPIQGESGVNSAETKFLKFLRSYATKHKIALIFDEIQCGVGRTGSLWNYEQHKVIPDIMTVAKPIGGGLPLGAVICKNKIASVIKPGDHGSTFGGNPLACALGSIVLNIVSKKSFLNNVQSKGNYLKNNLSEIAVDNDSILNVLGVGLMIGVRFKNDPTKIVSSCKKNGLLVIKAGNNTVRFMPPLTVSKNEIDKAVTIFQKALKG
jgi:predicted acetylornithine/succinylornithine family transaminase